MAPSDERHSQPSQERRVSDSAALAQSRRNDGEVPRPDGSDHALTVSESWVEIASQPSSSSLSSIEDDIVTTGLRVGSQRRRRVLQQQRSAPMPPSSFITHSTAQAGTGSSQEEYDETESEDDRLLTSSTENLNRPVPGLPVERTAIAPAVDSDSEDDDDRATALGKPSSSPTFRPQPNAFSHPPSHLQHRSHSTNSSVPQHAPFHRPSMSHRSQTRPNRAAHNFMSPSYREDNEAALRASLTTLLSCAAAARGLPKKDEPLAGPSGLRPSTQPMDLRLVAESELLAEPAVGPILPAKTASNSSAPSGPASTSSHDASAKAKRTAPASQAKAGRATKKKRTASSGAAVDGESAAFLSPTLLTWVVSAGVVVLVSVVSFGAGYVIGRETGYAEGSMGVGGLVGGGNGASNSSSCGREIVRSSTSGGTLRRFRWGAVGRSVAA